MSFGYLINYDPEKNGKKKKEEKETDHHAWPLGSILFCFSPFRDNKNGKQVLFLQSQYQLNAEIKQFKKTR